MRRSRAIVSSKWASRSPASPGAGVAGESVVIAITSPDHRKYREPYARGQYYLPDVRSHNTGGGRDVTPAERGGDDGEGRGLPPARHRADRPGRGAGGDPDDGAG